MAAPPGPWDDYDACEQACNDEHMETFHCTREAAVQACGCSGELSDCSGIQCTDTEPGVPGHPIDEVCWTTPDGDTPECNQAVSDWNAGYSALWTCKLACAPLMPPKTATVD